MKARFLTWAFALATLLGSALCASAAKESSLLLKFCDSEKQMLWPFASPAKLVPSSVQDPRQATVAGKIHVFTVKDSQVPVKIFAPDVIARHPWMGLRVGNHAGAYFELPAQPNQAIVKVRLRAGQTGSFCGEPCIQSIDGRIVKGGGVWSGKKTQGDEHVWTIEEPVAGQPLRLISTRNGAIEPQEIEVFYKTVKAKKAKKGTQVTIDAIFNSDTNTDGDLIFGLPTLGAAIAKNSGKNVPLKMGKYELTFWAEHGVAKATVNGGQKITGLVFNPAGNRKGEPYGEVGNAWIKAPAIDGLALVSVEVQCNYTFPSKVASGVMNLSSALINTDGTGNGDLSPEVYFVFTPGVTINIEKPLVGQPVWVCFKDAKNVSIKHLVLKYEKR
ncbi:MAG: hypothetical protein IJV01_00195 [Bacteroidales bacterium]|nr:hypothetical protein [Bacteroidales bacterium]